MQILIILVINSFNQKIGIIGTNNEYLYYKVVQKLQEG